MTEPEKRPGESERPPEREVDPADPEPRGNPEVDQPDVDEGREQIDKVAGN